MGYSLGALILTKYVAEADAGHYESSGAASSGAASSISDSRCSDSNGVDPAAPVSASDACSEPSATHGTSKSGLSGAALVSNPVCMSRAGERLAKPWTAGWLYNLIITSRLKAYMRQHRHQFELLPWLCFHTLREVYTLRGFDAAVTIHSAGFPSPDAYYAAGSSQGFIPRIRTRSLFLLAEDDPFLGCAGGRSGLSCAPLSRCPTAGT